MAHRDIHDENLCVLLDEDSVQATFIDLGVARLEGYRLEEEKKEDLETFEVVAEKARDLMAVTAVLESDEAEDDGEDEDFLDWIF